jgi:pimeloyl-ACP methyl ester carboxylesterase
MLVPKLLLVLVSAYAALVLIAYAAQTWLLFPASSAAGTVLLPPGAERIACETPDGERLAGARIAPAITASADRTRIIGFGGNAWNADHLAGYLHELFPAAEVITFHYRGYRPSTGRPSAAALLRDAPVVYDCAARGRDPASVVAIGFSIGTGVAVRLARERAVAGLILVTPFDTLEQVAREHYGWLPVGLLLRHHMAPVEELRAVTAPVALIAAERDTVIPVERFAPLRKRARNLIMDQTIRGADHNDIYSNPEFAQAMHRALSLVENRAKTDQANRTDGGRD